MLYRNKKTGVVIDVASTMKGAWEPVKAPGSDRAASDQKPKKAGKAKKAVSEDDRSAVREPD